MPAVISHGGLPGRNLLSHRLCVSPPQGVPGSASLFAHPLRYILPLGLVIRASRYLRSFLPLGSHHQLSPTPSQIIILTAGVAAAAAAECITLHLRRGPGRLIMLWGGLRPALRCNSQLLCK